MSDTNIIKNNKIKSKRNKLDSINTTKLINNFTAKYNKTNNKSPNTKPATSILNGANIKHLISENFAIIVLAIIAFAFIVLGLYLYFKESATFKNGKTYYGTDLLNYQPVFKINTDKIDPCVERCEKDTLCTGITYNKDTLQCLGTNKGTIRDDEANLTVWLKPKVKQLDPIALTLIGFTNNKKIIQPVDIPKPKLPHQFTYSFYLYINDFYENQGVWRHILHKGNDINSINTPNWEDISKTIPDQSIGVWMAPFHNNIRIALTTIQNINKDSIVYSHANKQEYLEMSSTNSKPNIFLTDIPYGKYADKNRATLRTNEKKVDYQKNLEYVDVNNIPIKKLIHITIAIHELMMEIYLDSKLHKIIELHGYPEYNSGNLIVLNKTAVQGDVLDLKFTSGSLKYADIIKLIDNKTELTNKYINY